MSAKTLKRETVVAEANRMIATAKTTKERQKLQVVFEHLLMAAGAYKGFNYTNWLNGGFDKWVADGRPTDNTIYLGDQTKVEFYKQTKKPTGKESKYMWALPNISSMNASKVVKQADYKRQLNLGRSIKHRCDSCNKPSVWHYPYYDIFSKDIAGVTHLCDDCEQRGLGGEGYFNCDSCQRRMVENITRERYCVEDGDGGIQCLACAAKQYFADPANQIEPQLVDTVSQGTDQAGLFNPETGNVELRRVKHVLGVGQSLPDGVKFVDNFENCNGAGRFDSRAILKAINEQKQPVFLVLDGAYQFSQSIGLYAKV